MRAIAFLAAALFCLASPLAAQTITVTEEALHFDERRIDFPMEEKSFIAVVGGAPKVFEPRGDRHSRRVFHWLELGMVAFSNPETNRVYAIELLCVREPYWKGLLSTAVVTIDGRPVSCETTVAELPAAGFKEKSASWRWSAANRYVLASSHDGARISMIEIGLRETQAEECVH